MSDQIEAILFEDARLDIEGLARCCNVSREWIIERVQCGIFMRVERDFECHPELAGLVADLIEEVEVLRARVKITELTNR